MTFLSAFCIKALTLWWLVPTKSSFILKQTCLWKLQVRFFKCVRRFSEHLPSKNWKLSCCGRKLVRKNIRKPKVFFDVFRRYGNATFDSSESTNTLEVLYLSKIKCVPKIAKFLKTLVKSLFFVKLKGSPSSPKTKKLRKRFNSSFSQ